MGKDDHKKGNNEEEEDLLDLEIDEDFLKNDLSEENYEDDSDEDIIDLVDVTEEDIEAGLDEKDIENLGDYELDEEKINAGQGNQYEGKENAKDAIGIEEDKAEDSMWGDELESDDLFGAEDNIDEELIMSEDDKEAFPGEEGSSEIDFLDDDELDEELEKLIFEEEGDGADDIGEEEIVEQEERPEKIVEEEGPAEEIVEQEEHSEEIVSQPPPLDSQAEYSEEAVRKEIGPLPEEKIEVILEKVASEVLERVAREVIPEVAEKIIREEIDILKKDMEI